MKNLVASVTAACSFLVILGVAPACAAQASQGVPLASFYEPIPGQPRVTADGVGGAIITWADSRRGDYDIYAQRVDANGAVQWMTSGVAICSEVQSQQSPQSISDGAGGAIITWVDFRRGDYDIYAQRIGADGAARWTVNGVAICSESHNQQSPQIASDGTGGAIITWVDFRTGGYDIYAQRVNGKGVSLWAGNGIVICSEAHDQRYPQIASDGAGGAIITWMDFRRGDYDIYAQRVDGNGAVMWTANGIGICIGIQNQVSPVITSDGAGGAIITWMDFRRGDYDIYAQRVNANGAAAWPVNGIGICIMNLDQVSPEITSDGGGGGIIAWADRRNGDFDIYVQRVSANGAVGWTPDGVGICTAVQDQFSPQITSDGRWGAIVAWMDSRGWSNDIFAQRVDADGRALWTANGFIVCSERHNQRYPQVVSDGAGGAIIAWADFRTGAYDIYAQRVQTSGVFWWTVNGVAIRSRARTEGRR